MVKLFKIHKYSGLTAGVLLFILAFTGFFLDHKNCSFMYNISFEAVPSSVFKHEKRLFEAYWVNPKNDNDIVVGSRRGIFHKKGAHFNQKLHKQCLSLRSDGKHLYAATNDGIYIFNQNQWQPFHLKGLFINAMALYEGKILASVDKKELVLIDLSNKKILSRTKVLIKKESLNHAITLSRFVRDVHYGRGLFDGITSLLINDYAALILLLLSLSGYLIYFLITTKKHAQLSKKLIKLHANFLSILAILPFILLLITGIFLDHAKLFGEFMRSVSISHSVLPPVYGSLTEDIWSVDLDKNTYRIGNRYGVYESANLQEWKLVSKGFAYKIKRIGNTVYVSGMGAPNRVFHNEKWSILPKTPHMFKDINIIKEDKIFLSHKSKIQLPQHKEASLYCVLLALHDGTFFSSWWVWINDIAAILLFVLGITGTLRYLRKKRVI